MSAYAFRALRCLCLTQLEPVAERVVDVAAGDTRKRPVGTGLVAGCAQALLERDEIVDDEAGMRLAGRREGLLDSHMQLLAANAEPAAAARRQRLRLRQLLETQQPAVERARRRLTPGRCRDLHMVDPDDPHVRRVYHRWGGAGAA